MRRGVVITLSLLALLAIGVVGFGAYAFAQVNDGGPPWRGGPPWAAGGHGWGRGHDDWGPDPERVRQARADLAEDLARELETTPEQVEGAFRAVVASRLQEAAQDGRIDSADADEALAAYDEGDVRVLFRVLKHDAPATEPSPGA